jgi:hypothetical protein
MTRAGVLRTSLQLLTWCCVVLLAVLSLLPAQEMVRTGFPGQLEHFIAYAGSAGIAMVGYGLSRGGMCIGGFSACAGVLEYLQHFSPGRHPPLEDFAASALGAQRGGAGRCPPLAFSRRTPPLCLLRMALSRRHH